MLISKWAYNQKMLFNPDPSKPAHEVLFSRKKQGKKLNFKQHIDSTISKLTRVYL